MSIFEITFTFIVSWWMLLLMLLPIASKLPETPDAAHYHSAPTKTYLKQKMLGSAVLAVLVTVALYYIFESSLIETWLPYRF